MRNFHSSAVAILVVLLMLAACTQGTATPAPSDEATPSVGGSEPSADAESPDAAPSFESVQLQFAASGGPESGNGIGLQHWADLISERTDGQVTVETFLNGELGAERDVMDQLVTGTVDGSVITSSVLSNLEPSLQVLDLPFLFPDREAPLNLYSSSVGGQLLDSLEAKGIKGVGWTVAGVRTILNNVRPVRTPADVEGLKIRTIESPLFVAIWENLGAIPTPIPIAEIYSALERGVVDGADVAPGFTVAQNYHEVGDYFTVTAHTIASSAYVLAGPTWDSISPELQEIVLQAGREAAELQTDVVRDQDAAALDVMRDAGLEVIDSVDSEPFRALMEPVWADYRDLLGDELVNSVVETVESP